MRRSLLRLLVLLALSVTSLRPALAAPPARTIAHPAPRLAAEAAAPGAIAPAPVGCNLSTSTFANVATVPIPTSGTITATVTVSGMSTFLWDVNLTTNLAHGDSDDLDVWLTSPSGTVSTITTDNGNNRQNVFDGTVWDDQATRAVSDAFFVADTVVPTLIPEEAMGAFIGENPNGIWKLTIEDDTPNAHGGEHGGWALAITTLPVFPTKTTHTVSDDNDFAIPDFGNLVRTLNVTDGPAALGRLILTTRISHARNEDLDVLLISPSGVTQTITSDNGGALAGGYTLVEWYDRAGLINAPGPVSESTFIANASQSPLVPEGALSAFNGLETNGTWKLIISDDLPINTGTLKEWSLELQGYNCLTDLSVMQTKVAPYVAPSSPVTFTISVANVSSVPAANVEFNFELPPGITLLQPPSLNGWQCAVKAGNTGFACTRASLSGGLSTFFEVYAQAPAVPGPVIGALSVSTSSTESSELNNSTQPTAYAGLFSANGQPWVVSDTNHGADDGAILDGGQGALADWGGLRLRVTEQNGGILTDNAWIKLLDLDYQGNRRWASATTIVHSGVAVSRHIWAPAHTNWVRYVDVYANTSSAYRSVGVAWGGLLGSGNKTTVAGTSTGDVNITSSDTWVVTIQNSSFNPNGPAEEPPIGMLVGSAAVDHYFGAYDWADGPFTTAWPGNGHEDLAHMLEFGLPAHTTMATAYFLYRGLAEGVAGPAGCTTNCVTPPTGSQIALAQSTLIALEANPPLCDLPPSILAVISNWPEADDCRYVFVPVVRR